MPDGTERPANVGAAEGAAYIVSTDSWRHLCRCRHSRRSRQLSRSASRRRHPKTRQSESLRPSVLQPNAPGSTCAACSLDARCSSTGRPSPPMAMIQRGTGAKAGLITTRGFEDTLIIGRVRSRWVGLDETALAGLQERRKRPPPVVPTSLIRGVAERIDCFGNVLVPLDLAEAEKAIDDLVQAGVESLAVCLLWSFRNAEHESARLRHWPDANIRLSTSWPRAIWSRRWASTSERTPPPSTRIWARP